MDAKSTVDSSTDEFGFPCQLSRKGMQRLKIRKFTSESQWAARFPSLDSILKADKQVIDGLALTHGLPAAHRASIWLHHCRLTRKVYGLAEEIDYAAACAASASLDVEICKQIELDLPRTFPEQEAFASALAMKHGAFDGSRSSAAVCAAAATSNSSLFVPGAGDIHDSVRRMLRAFCVSHPDIGYLQSMNFVSAFILLVFGRQREQEAYYVFETFIACNLRGYYQPDMAALHADCALITSLLRERQPRLMQWLDKLGLPDVGALFLPRWLLCGFLNCFPSDITVRVWDLLFLEGVNAPVVLAETTLAVFRMVAGDLLACGGTGKGGAGDGNCFAEAIEVLKTVGLRITDSAELLHLSRHAECSMRQGQGQGGLMEDIHSWRRRIAGWTAPWDPTLAQAGSSSVASSAPPVMFSPKPQPGAQGQQEDEEGGCSSPSSHAPALSMSMLAAGHNHSMSASGHPLSRSMSMSMSTSHALEGSMVAPGPVSAAKAVLLRVSGLGTRGSPVAIEQGLDRVLPALPFSPQTGHAASTATPHGAQSLLKSLRSPLRSPVPLPALAGSPVAGGTGRAGRGGGAGAGAASRLGYSSIKSPLGLRSPAAGPLALASLSSSFALGPSAQPAPLDSSAIAEALNASVAAASTRKRKREGAAMSEGLAGVASALAASATATAMSLGARLGMSMGGGAGSKAPKDMAAQGQGVPSAEAPLPLHPTAYSEFDHGQEGIAYGTAAGQAGLIPLTRAASLRALHEQGGEEGASTAHCEGAENDGEDAEDRAGKRARSSAGPLRSTNVATSAAPQAGPGHVGALKAVPGSTTRQGAGSKSGTTAGHVQLMLMSPIRTGVMRKKA